MTRNDRSLEEFRRRLRVLIADRFEGKYSLLARRAGIPISSLQYCLHHATRFPGGDHLLRLATALGVSVDFLLSGQE